MRPSGKNCCSFVSWEGRVYWLHLGCGSVTADREKRKPFAAPPTANAELVQQGFGHRERSRCSFLALEDVTPMLEERLTTPWMRKPALSRNDSWWVSEETGRGTK